MGVYLTALCDIFRLHLDPWRLHQWRPRIYMIDTPRVIDLIRPSAALCNERLSCSQWLRAARRHEHTTRRLYREGLERGGRDQRVGVGRAPTAPRPHHRPPPPPGWWARPEATGRPDPHLTPPDPQIASSDPAGFYLSDDPPGRHVKWWLASGAPRWAYGQTDEPVCANIYIYMYVRVVYYGCHGSWFMRGRSIDANVNGSDLSCIW